MPLVYPLEQVQGSTPTKNTTVNQKKESSANRMNTDNSSFSTLLDSISKQFNIKKSDIWKRQFLDLEKWLGERDLKVSLEKDCEDIIEWGNDLIRINSKPKWENRYYALLHECGHIIVSENPENFEYNYPYYVDQKDDRRKNSDAYRVSILGEEIESWKLGRNLGDNILNHFINHKKFDRMMTECVMSYVFWATEEEE